MQRDPRKKAAEDRIGLIDRKRGRRKKGKGREGKRGEEEK